MRYLYGFILVLLFSVFMTMVLWAFSNGTAPLLVMYGASVVAILFFLGWFKAFAFFYNKWIETE